MIVNIEQVITRAKFRLGLESTFEHNDYLKKLIEEAARGLNASSTYIVSCETKEIECGVAQLPDEYDSLVGFTFNNGGSCSGCCHATVDPNPPSENQIVVCTCRDFYGVFNQNVIFLQHGSCGWYGNYFAINGNYLTFPSTITATEVNIYFRGFNTDENGLMIIDEEQERGLSAYAAAQFSLDRANIIPPAYTPEQRLRWTEEWKAQKKYVNGKQAIRNFKLQKNDIALIANAVLSNRRYPAMGYPMI